ncbi:acyl-CoA N-acyltransferase [Trametes punicea]|nr:acyl-CoA N-acyltransferase [Trametes punicea]
MESDDIQTTLHNYEICAVPAPPTSADIETVRDLRLTALQTDPKCFSSSYEREAAFTKETWKERLNGKGKATFVIRAHTTQRGNERRNALFVGTATVLSTSALPEIALPDSARSGVAFLVAGMWVASEHRRRGLGRRLLQAALAWTREQVRMVHEDTTTDHRLLEVFLMVASENEAAIRLYTGMGFERLSMGRKEGREDVWMRCLLDINASQAL